MRIGIFGGTFDPVHLGHLILAETVAESCQLDEVRFVPAKLPPHKLQRQLTPPRMRIDMLEFAIAGNHRFRIDECETHRSGPSYTVDTLRNVRAELPYAQLYLMIGADSLTDFPTWRHPHEILELARIAAVNRGKSHGDLDAVAEQLAAALPAEVPLDSSFGDAGPTPPTPWKSTIEFRARIEFVEMPAVEISASELRRKCRLGQSIRYQTPRPVELYVHEHQLYRTPTHGA